MSRAARRRKSASSFGPGTVISDRYTLGDKLGEGGMAEVFSALDVESGQRVAIKILHSDVATNPEAVERTKREGRLLSRIDNPAIVQVESWGELPDGSVFLVMELLDGETLGERMRRGAMDPGELAPIVAGTCAGLHAAHRQGIIHRDLKPDNIFLCPTEHGLQVKLLDFGISKVYGGPRLTQTGEVLGTPRYMSPEQLGAEPDVDGRVDGYALGVILYEALAGRPPFLAATPTDLIVAILNGKVTPLRSVRPDLPPGVEEVVMRAMSKVRAARYDSALDLARAYIDAVGGVQAVRHQQKRGMATRAFGGKLESTGFPSTNPPPPSRLADDISGSLELGTFSGLPEMAAAGVPGGSPPDSGVPRPDAPEAPAQGVAPPSPSSARAPVGEPWTKARRPMPDTREAPLGLIPETPLPAAPATSRVVAATEMMDMTGAGVQRPPPAVVVARHSGSRRRAVLGRALVVVAALLAGAASAAAVILLLTWRGADEEPASGGATPAVTEERPTPVAPEEPEPSVEPAAEPEVEPEPPSPRGARASGSRSPRRRRSSSRGTTGRRRAARDSVRRGGAPPPDPSSPGEMVRAARQALRAGDAERCVSILDRAIQSGAPAIALRRRGECYERMGRRTDAIQDYTRFCRIAHDHPAIAEVRPLLESWGRRCR